MRERWATLLLAGTLSACATTGNLASPYNLSDADRAAVAKTLFTALDKLDSPEYRFRGGQTSNGKIIVCGWVSDRGAYSDRLPFIGTLSGGLFVIDHLGNSYATRDYVLNECKELGIPLN